MQQRLVLNRTRMLNWRRRAHPYVKDDWLDSPDGLNIMLCHAQGDAGKEDEAQILSHVALAKQLLRARDTRSPKP